MTQDEGVEVVVMRRRCLAAGLAGLKCFSFVVTTVDANANH